MVVNLESVHACVCAHLRYMTCRQTTWNKSLICVSAATVQQRPISSLLTDEEQDAQYRAVITAARRNADVSGGLNSVSSSAVLLRVLCVAPLPHGAEQCG